MSRCASALLWVLALLPALFTYANAVAYHVPVPFSDDWTLSWPLGDWYKAGFPWAELWRPNNEHRVIFPAAVLLVLIRASGWNVPVVLAASIAGALGVLSLLIFQLRRTAGTLHCPLMKILMPVFSMVIFSLSQWNIWLVAIFFAVVLCVLCSVACLLILAQAPPRLGRMIPAGLCSILATFSYGYGILLWPVGSWVLFVSRSKAGLGSTRAPWVWALAGVAALCAYLYEWQHPSFHPNLLYGFVHPVTFSKYVLTFLGSPLAAGHAAAVGAVGAGLFAGCAWHAGRSDGEVFRPLLPWMALGWLAIAAAFLSGLARCGFGVEYALTPHYIAFGSLVWIANLVLVCAFAKRLSHRLASWLLIAGVMFGVFNRGADGLNMMGWVHKELVPAAEALREMKDEQLYGKPYVYPRGLRRGAQVLRDHRLSIFRREPRL